MSDSVDYAQLRRDYLQPPFNKNMVDSDPFKQFEIWFKQIQNVSDVDPNAMTLATVSANGIPNARVVLLKGVENGGFLFYTNYQSDKGVDMDHNPKVCLNFYWPQLSRQVRIVGSVERLSDDENTAYFQSRPRESQIGAWSSPQSTPIKNRDILEKRFKDMELRFEKSEKIERPKQWGGYKVIPFSIEFWQGRPSRLHDRILYFKDKKNNWNIQRLAP